MTLSTGSTRAPSPARKPVLFLQHAREKGPGAVAEVFGECILPWRCRRLMCGESVPASLDEYAMLVVLDGPKPASAESARAEAALVRLAVERDFPTMGIGAGAALIAEAAGGRVTAKADAAIGWHEVRLTSDGRLDPAFHALPPAFPGFLWHRQAIQIPEGAIGLATSAACDDVAFRIGRHVFGFQYHPEVTGWMVERWMAAELAADAADLAATLRRECASNDDPSRQRLRDLLRGLLPAVGLVDAAAGLVVNRAVSDRPRVPVGAQILAAGEKEGR